MLSSRNDIANYIAINCENEDMVGTRSVITFVVDLDRVPQVFARPVPFDGVPAPLFSDIDRLIRSEHLYKCSIPITPDYGVLIEGRY